MSTSVFALAIPPSGHRVVLAVAVATASALGFAVSNALQHRVAGSVPEGVDRSLAVLAHLARRRLWLFATSVSFTALTLHAVALHIGSIALVQPLMLVAVVLAVPLRAVLDHTRPTPRELRAVLVTAVGLAVFLACAAPAPSPGGPQLEVAVTMVVAGVAATLVVIRTAANRLRARGPHAQAAALGAAAGV